MNSPTSSGQKVHFYQLKSHYCNFLHSKHTDFLLSTYLAPQVILSASHTLPSSAFLKTENILVLWWRVILCSSREQLLSSLEVFFFFFLKSLPLCLVNLWHRGCCCGESWQKSHFSPPPSIPVLFYIYLPPFCPYTLSLKVWFYLPSLIF